MAGVLAAIVLIALLTALLVAVRSRGEIALTFQGDARQSRLLWSSVSLCALVMWVGGVGGAFASLTTPVFAEAAALLIAVASGGWWLALAYADRELERESARSSNPSGRSTATPHSSQAAETPVSPSRTQPPFATGSPPPGWYADPWENGAMRRWNGVEWTMETRTT